MARVCGPGGGRLRPHRGRQLGQRAPDRRFPAHRPRRDPARAAHRPPAAPQHPGGCRPAASGRLLRSPVRDQRRPDRRARVDHRRGDEPLQAGGVRRAPEPRRRRGPRPCKRDPPVGRELRLGGRRPRGRSPGRRLRPRCRVLAECGNIRRLGALHPRHSPEPRGAGTKPQRRSPLATSSKACGW